ncbi:MAG: hypothetical protein KatS3mg101_0357 [Patescibacteria group bacterium]|nr:MAG: hypothetical protein KatS3mg101_0357 [Patescibacteria group bacterium]
MSNLLNLLSECIKKFEKMKFDPQKCKERASQFSREVFECSIMGRI